MIAQTDLQIHSVATLLPLRLPIDVSTRPKRHTFINADKAAMLLRLMCCLVSLRFRRSGRPSQDWLCIAMVSLTFASSGAFFLRPAKVAPPQLCQSQCLGAKHGACFQDWLMNCRSIPSPPARYSAVSCIHGELCVVRVFWLVGGEGDTTASWTGLCWMRPGCGPWSLVLARGQVIEHLVQGVYSGYPCAQLLPHHNIELVNRCLLCREFEAVFPAAHTKLWASEGCPSWGCRKWWCCLTKAWHSWEWLV